jgi:hypothetical protein
LGDTQINVASGATITAAVAKKIRAMAYSALPGAAAPAS